MHETKRVDKPMIGLIPILSLAVIMFASIVGLGFDDPRLALVIGCVIASLVSLRLGYRWQEVIDFMVSGVSEAVEAILILMSIGILVGVWIASGTVPSMIFYGLKVISPRFFLPAAFIVCSLVSMIVGSWGAAGTIGIAFMGIGAAIGTDPALIAGAIVAGSYVGDKISPFSDGTNLAATVSGADVISVVKQMLPIILVAYVISALGYTALGLALGSSGGDLIASAVAPVINRLDDAFVIGPFALLPLLVMLLMIFLKLPALPSMLSGAFVGAVQAVAIQGCSVRDIMDYATNGYICQTGYAVLDELLSAGGLQTMLRTISIILIAMAFGGIMQGSGQMQALVAPLTRRVSSVGGMIALIVVTCFGVNMLLPDQYLGIAVPGQMYREECRQRGIDKRLLANTLGAGAAVTSPLIPWNTCGMYISSILGVGAASYAPYSFFNYLLPIIIILYGVLFGKRAKHSD